MWAVRGHVGDAVANEYARQVDHRTSFRGRNLVLVVYFAREDRKIATLLTVHKMIFSELPRATWTVNLRLTP